MGRDLYEVSSQVRELYKEANRILGFDLAAVSFAEDDAQGNGRQRLSQTDVTQPAIFVHSLAVFTLLDQHPDAVAGHSVGECAALVASGALRFSDGLQAVKHRSQQMAKACQQRSGTMCAVLGLAPEAVEALCEEASGGGQVVVPANYNDPKQIVISGDPSAIAKASALASAQGARRVLPLRVSGAFHSPLMQPAAVTWAEHTSRLSLNAPECPVYLNTLGRGTTDVDEIRREIALQLTAPVFWMQSLEAMQADGCEQFVEVGPGRVLSGLVRRTLGRRAKTTALGNHSAITRYKESKEHAIFG